MEEILRVEDVSHTYQAENGEINAFEHISFTVRRGAFLSIVGPSGCGKSTLLRNCRADAALGRAGAGGRRSGCRRFAACRVYAAAR